MSQRSILLELLRNTLPLVILAVGGFGFYALFSMRAAPAQVERAPAVREIQTVPVAVREDGFQMELDGVVVPHREIEISAEVSGRVVYKSPDCRPGRFVHTETSKGEANVLIRIDPATYQLEVERLERMVEQADLAVEELDEDLAGTRELAALASRDAELQSAELQRAKQIMNALSETEIAQAERAELAARNALVKLQSQQRLLTTRRASLLASRQLAQTELKRAQLELSRTQIVVPRDGVIVREMVEQDSHVQPGEPLLEMEDTSKAEVQCSLQMDQMYWIWRNAEPELLARQGIESDYELPPTRADVIYHLNGQDFVWQGELRRFDGIGIDQKTRTIPCRVVVDQPREVEILDDQGQTHHATGPPVLIRGMYVTVRIHLPQQQDIFEVPQQAVQPGKIVWTIRDNSLRRVPVQLVKLYGPVLDSTAPDAPATALVHAAQSELKRGDRVVITSLPDVADGTDVSQWNVDPAASADSAERDPVSIAP